MPPFAITADFHIHHGRMPDFLPLVLDNARSSQRNEPGCRRFDVLIPQAGSDWLRLYEIYDSEADFDVHCRTPHFLAFKAATGDMVARLVVERFALAGQ
ncbi:MAG: antibiotic biosynthesis monooxygenase [Betaproteobacteria bacterium]|nr:antibiotic biosynthesis monooxygenase [Betaproteobacteria bacterium]